MTSTLRMRWGSIVAASVSVLVISATLVWSAVFIYAFSLGWAARGAPDSVAIQQFAGLVGPVWGPRLSVLLTVAAAIWLGRRVPVNPTWHGVLVGLIVAGIPLALTRRVGSASIVFVAITLLAGAGGGWLGSKLRGTRAPR